MDRPESAGRLHRAARSAAAMFVEIQTEEHVASWPPDAHDRPRLEIITDEPDARVRAAAPFVEFLILTVGEPSRVVCGLANELARRSANARGDSFAAVVLNADYSCSRRRRGSGGIELREYDSVCDATEAGARRLIVLDTAEHSDRKRLGESRVGAAIAISLDVLDGAYSRLLEDELKDRYSEASVHVFTISELAAAGRAKPNVGPVGRARRASKADINRMVDALLQTLHVEEEAF